MGYFIAIVLKSYNFYFYLFLDTFLEAKRSNKKQEDIIRERYFCFFTQKLPQSEKKHWFAKLIYFLANGPTEKNFIYGDQIWRH